MEEIHKKPLNPILQKFGRSDFFKFLLINSIKTKICIHTKKKINSNLLQKTQFDILNKSITTNKKIKKNTQKNILKKPISSKDYSISIHICHNLQREIEILKDQLLNIFNTNPKIKPYHVVVKAKNIDIYSNFINGIFGSLNKQLFIPYVIANNNFFHKDKDILINFINKILNLPENNFDIHQVLSFLNLPFLSKKFFIKEKDIKLLEKLVDQINIKWGLDQRHFLDILIPCKEYNTWQYNINKILLNHAIGPTKKIWNNIISYNESNKLNSELIGKLSGFINLLIKWRIILKHPKQLKTWKKIISELFNDFFCKKNDIIKSKIALIEDSINYIIQTGINNQHNKKININLLKTQIISKINQQSKNQQLFIGSTIFCNLKTLQGIPFKINCILGLNENIDKNHNKLETFDLMHKYPDKNDPNLKQELYFLILESFLSSQKYFYMSFAKEEQNTTIKYSNSLFINKIIDFISTNYYLNKDKNLCSKQQSKNIISHICFFHQKHPYDKKNFAINKPYVSFDTQWYQFLKLINTHKIHYSKSLPYIKKRKINLEKLIKFWRHPIRYFFNYRLKINFNSINLKKTNTEPFKIDKITHCQLNKDIFQSIIHQKNIDEVFKIYEKSGKLPHGYFGNIIFQQYKEKIFTLVKNIAQYRKFPKNKKFKFQINNYYIYGNLSEICQLGLIKYQPNNLNFQSIISFWIEHLIYCLLETKKRKLFIRIK